MTNPYDLLAPHYREYAMRKSAYLDAVDDFILDNLPASRGSLLDVGAGDGVRGMALARRIGAGRVVLAEPAREMAALCRMAEAIEVWQCAAQELPLGPERFDIVLCLWNVLGHLPSPTDRIAALTRMAALLAPGGRIFLDVNNRYNAKAYGRFRVLGRRAIDFVAPDPVRGDAEFVWRIGDQIVPSMGHLFTPGELAQLVASSPLRMRRRVAIDYASGRMDESPFNGQLVLVLEK